MILQPCLRCSFRHDCNLKRDTQLRARGLPLTSAWIKCPIRLANLQPGQRVTVKIWNAVQVETYDDIKYESRTYPGTLLGPAKSGPKLLVWLDAPLECLAGQATGRVRVRVHHDNLTPIEGVDPICEECGNPQSKGAEWCERLARHVPKLPV